MSMASSPCPFLQLYLTSCNLWLCHDELFQSFPNKGTISLSVFLLHLDNSDLNIHFRYHILWETLPNCPSLGWLPLLYVPRFFFLQLLSSHQMSLATSFTRLTALQWQGPAPIMFTLPALVPGQVHIVNILEWMSGWMGGWFSNVFVSVALFSLLTLLATTCPRSCRPFRLQGFKRIESLLPAMTLALICLSLVELSI